MPDTPDVREIVRAYLVEHGYEGLLGDECGCDLKDLMPASGEQCLDCVPAYHCPIKPCAHDSEYMGRCMVGDKTITKCPEDEEGPPIASTSYPTDTTKLPEGPDAQYYDMEKI